MGILGAVSSALVAVVVLSPSVEAHGWIEKPLARQFCNGNTVRYLFYITSEDIFLYMTYALTVLRYPSCSCL